MTTCRVCDGPLSATRQALDLTLCSGRCHTAARRMTCEHQFPPSGDHEPSACVRCGAAKPLFRDASPHPHPITLPCGRCAEQVLRPKPHVGCILCAEGRTPADHALGDS